MRLFIIFTILLLAGCSQQLGGTTSLKANKSDILYSHEFTQYEYETEDYVINATGTPQTIKRQKKDVNGKPIIKSQEQMIVYGYKSDEVVPAFDNEIIELRTNKKITRQEGEKKFSQESGYNFWQDGEVWKQVRVDVVSKQDFDKQVSWLDKIIHPALAVDTGATFPVNAGRTYNTWTNPTNACLGNPDDGTYTTVTNGANNASAAFLSWDGDNTYTGYLYPTRWFLITDVLSVQTLGSATYLWGRTWSASDFLDANFALMVDVYSGGASQGSPQDWYNFGFTIPDGSTIDGIEVKGEGYYEGSYTTYYDYFTVKVYYTEPEPEAKKPDVIWFN